MASSHYSALVALCFGLLVAVAEAKKPLSTSHAAGVIDVENHAISQNGIDTTHMYTQFLKTHRPDEQHSADSLLWQQRCQMFEAEHAKVQQQNAKKGKLWVAALNRFADLTHDERQAMFGYKPGLQKRSHLFHASKLQGFSGFGMAHTQKGFLSESAATLAKSADWRHLESAKFHRDQGLCGSCWAVASTGVLEMHAELAHKLHGSWTNTTALSYQQLVDCVPNPDKCGGSGGCDGATADLAFEYVKKYGIALKDDFHPGNCFPFLQAHVVAQSFAKLPSNKAAPLMHALSTVGPVVGGADATNWFAYKRGIFDACSKDATLNHAFVLMGYGSDPVLQADYWLLRNSWGTQWGEKGYMRLLRNSSDDEAWCGTDFKPSDGVSCAGGPASVKVCGMCGITYDAAYPIGVHFVNATSPSSETESV